MPFVVRQRPAPGSDHELRREELGLRPRRGRRGGSVTSDGRHPLAGGHVQVHHDGAGAEARHRAHRLTLRRLARPGGHAGPLTQPHARRAHLAEDTHKRLAELDVEYGVDDGVEAAVAVAEPGERLEGEARHARLAEGGHDVDAEEGHVADEEDPHDDADRGGRLALGHVAAVAGGRRRHAVDGAQQHRLGQRLDALPRAAWRTGRAGCRWPASPDTARRS